MSSGVSDGDGDPHGGSAPRGRGESYLVKP